MFKFSSISTFSSKVFVQLCEMEINVLGGSRNYELCQVYTHLVYSLLQCQRAGSEHYVYVLVAFLPCCEKEGTYGGINLIRECHLALLFSRLLCVVISF